MGIACPAGAGDVEAAVLGAAVADEAEVEAAVADEAEVEASGAVPEAVLGDLEGGLKADEAFSFPFPFPFLVFAGGSSKMGGRLKSDDLFFMVSSGLNSALFLTRGVISPVSVSTFSGAFLYDSFQMSMFLLFRSLTENQ